MKYIDGIRKNSHKIASLYADTMLEPGIRAIPPTYRAWNKMRFGANNNGYHQQEQGNDK